MPKDVKKKIIIEVDDKGDLKRTKKKIDALNKSSDRASKSSREYDRNMKGLSKQSSNASKNFSKQAQGMQGVLVPAYAEIAARVFALSAAFMALSKAADYSILIQGQQAYARMTGKNMASIAKSVQVASKHMLDFKEASTSVALASTSGISSQQIVAMTKAAVDSSAALGRSVTDTMDRLTRGIVKAEPEILDEIGVIIRLDKVYKDYAETMMKTSQELTEAEKATARYNAIMGQLETKFGGISDAIDPNYFAALSATIMDIINKVSSMSVTWIGGPLKFLTESKTLLVAIMALVLKTIGGKIFPAFANFGQKLTEMPKKFEDRIKNLKGSIKKLNTEIKGSTAELEKFAKKTAGDRMTPGMVAARKSGDIKKYTQLQTAAIKRAEKTLEGDGRRRVKGGSLQGMNLKDLEALKKKTKSLDKIQERFATKRQLELKKHSHGIQKLQLGYTKLKLGVSRFGAQQVALLNMSFSAGIKQIGKDWTAAGGRAKFATNVMKAGISGVTVMVKGLGAALNAAFKIFMWITMIFSMVKMVASMFMDMDKPFKKAAKAAKTLNAELKKTVENLNERPDNINFEGIAANFADALKNADFAANLADEIYNATHKAMKKLTVKFAEMGWLDRLVDRMRGLVGMSTFRDELQGSVESQVTMAKTTGGTLPKGLQYLVDNNIGATTGSQAALGDLVAKEAEWEDVIAAVAETRASEYYKPKIMEPYLEESLEKANKGLLEVAAESAKLEAFILNEVLSKLSDTQLITFMKELDKINEHTAKSTKKHQVNLKELGLTYGKVAKYEREYAESVVSKTEYYDLAKSQQALQNLFDEKGITSSEKILGAIAGGYIDNEESKLIKKYQADLVDEKGLLGRMEAGQVEGADELAIAKQIKDIEELTNKIYKASDAMFWTDEGDKKTAAGILGYDWVTAQETALKAATDRLALDYESKALQMFGTGALERQNEIKKEILNQEITALVHKIATDKLDVAAKANAEELLRLKRVDLAAVDATALAIAERQAKIEGRKLGILERTKLILQDIYTTYGMGTMSDRLAGEAVDKQTDDIETFFSSYARGLNKSINLTEKQTEWANNWNQAIKEGIDLTQTKAAIDEALAYSSFAGITDPKQLMRLLANSKVKGIGEAHFKAAKSANLLGGDDRQFKKQVGVVELYWKVVNLQKENLKKEDYIVAERKLLETELINAREDLIDARWKARTEDFAKAVQTIADGFGSAISKHFNDIFMNKKPEKGAFRTAIAQAFASAGSNMIGSMAQKQVFGNQGFVANMMRKIPGMSGDWIDTLFPKSELELAEQRTNYLSNIWEKYKNDGGGLFGSGKAYKPGVAGAKIEDGNYEIRGGIDGVWELVNATRLPDIELEPLTKPLNFSAAALPTTLSGHDYAGDHPLSLKRTEEIANETLIATQAIVTNTGENGTLGTLGGFMNSLGTTAGRGKGLWGMITGSSGGGFGTPSIFGKGPNNSFGSQFGSQILGAVVSSFLPFGSGGVASGGFRAFANGGIANRPTLGMVGEGKYNEAVVPLPDGKSIPVKGAGDNNVTVNVSVDAQGQSSATEASGNGAKELGFMLSQAVQAELVEQQRPGGLLSSY